MPPKRIPLETRFWPKVNKTESCWLWTAGVNTGGYGKIYDPEVGRDRAAHIVAWEFANGPVPEGLELDHLCRNPNCVNPAHLEPVTGQVNTQRAKRNKEPLPEIRKLASSTTLVSLRLSDELYAAIEREAEIQERSKSSIIIRALRSALAKGVMPSDSNNGVPAMTATAKTAVVAESESKFRTSPDGKACRHGLYRCDRGCWK